MPNQLHSRNQSTTLSKHDRSIPRGIICEMKKYLAQRRKGAKEAVRMMQLFSPLFWAGGSGFWAEEDATPLG